MPELLVDFITSLDGYGAAEGWPRGPLSRGRLPVITGSTGGDRIYDGYPDVALDMINSRTFDGRTQLLEYVPTVLAGPPGTEKADR
jgi:hypothetical protein